MKRFALLLCLLPVLLFAKDGKASRGRATCGQCHITHVADTNAAPSLRPRANECISCHDGMLASSFDRDALGHAMAGYAESEASCSSCHDPHRSHL